MTTDWLCANCHQMVRPDGLCECFGGKGWAGRDPLEQAKAAARAQVMVLEERAEARIREIVREEIQRVLVGGPAGEPWSRELWDESRERDTIPAPPGESWSGADVVPRGSSRPPGFVTEANVSTVHGLGKKIAGYAVTESIVDIPGACAHCRMLACVCAHRSAGVGDTGQLDRVYRREVELRVNGTPVTGVPWSARDLETGKTESGATVRLPDPDNGHGAADGFPGSDYQDVWLSDNNEGGIDK